MAAYQYHVVTHHRRALSTSSVAGLAILWSGCLNLLTISAVQPVSLDYVRGRGLFGGLQNPWSPRDRRTLYSTVQSLPWTTRALVLSSLTRDQVVYVKPNGSVAVSGRVWCGWFNCAEETMCFIARGGLEYKLLQFMQCSSFLEVLPITVSAIPQ